MDIFVKINSTNFSKLHHWLKFHQRFQTTSQLIVGNKIKPELTSKWIRNSFIDYFVSKQNHTFVKSSPVLPENDESLLFVNAGMNQFKDIFQNRLSPTDPRNGYIRCVNSQKCIRVGGKHCDLSSVGTDGRHQTFFEMLGNWSFGDYYKNESCLMAWDLLTKVFKLDPNRMIVTYFGGDKQLGLEPDFETKDIWLKIGLPEYRVLPLGAKDNFWEMGETGPCGICTEIHYQLEPTSSTDPKVLLDNSIEIWNIVFMQFDRKPNGKLDSLHKHFVDTGMGLERIASVVQNVKTNYETDLFIPYFNVIQKMSHCRPYSGSSDETLDISYRILADHSRMFTVAISDGLLPSYRKTGFILRKIIRKSIGIAANDFGISNARPLFTDLISITRDLLSEAFPELNTNIKRVNQVINEEIEKYESVVTQNKRLMNALNQLNIEYSIDLNEKLNEKLDEIEDQINRLAANDVNKQFLDSKKDYLFSIKDVISDYTINLRHNLTIDFIERVDKLLDRLEDIESQLISSFKTEFKSIIDLNNNSNYFVYEIKTIGDSNVAFKLGLDFFGQKPTALFHKSSDGKEFFVQTAVPNQYQKLLKANEWLSQISNKLDNFEVLSKKRTHKMCSLKSNSFKQMKAAISCAEYAANVFK